VALSHGGELVFPGTLPGQNLSLTLTIRNTGLAALSDLVLSSADAEWMVMSLGLTTLAVNQTTTAVVRFSPVKTGVKTGTLRLTSNVAGAKNPYVLGLRGAGTALPKATTNGETNVASTTVTLNGRVTPNHDTATAFFQYQKTSETAWTTVGSQEVGGFEVVLCSFNASGLTPATNYRYRLAVYNGVNTAAAPVYGANNLFTTLP
jgi:hypothetical protein